MQLADADEKWEKLLEEHKEWVNPPIQPPGLSRSGRQHICTCMFAHSAAHFSCLVTAAKDAGA